MADLNADLSKLQEMANKFNNISLSDCSYFIRPDILPEIPTIEIDEENTFAYQMQQQTNQIIGKSNEQIKLLVEQNKQLETNYQKLEELYALKDKELQEARKNEKRAKIYNNVMMFIAVASMLVAVAAWLLPNVLGGAS